MPEGEIVIDVEPVGSWMGLAGLAIREVPVLVGVDFGPSGSDSPHNWNSWSGGSTQDTLTDLINESGDATPFELIIDASTGSFSTAGGQPDDLEIPTHTNPLDDISGNIWSSGDATFTWTGLNPGTQYEIYVFGLDTASNEQEVTLTGDGTPVVFTQDYSPNELWVNDEMGDVERSLTSYAIPVAADANGEIVIDVQPVSTWMGLRGLAIRPLAEAETPQAQVVGRHIFYHGSAFYITSHDDTIAPDKHALLPGETATFANYTSYSRGINGVMVDIDGLADPTSLSLSDFQFHVGNDDDAWDWSTATAPVSLNVREGEGAGGSDRVELIWADNW